MVFVASGSFAVSDPGIRDPRQRTRKFIQIVPHAMTITSARKRVIDRGQQ